MHSKWGLLQTLLSGLMVVVRPLTLTFRGVSWSATFSYKPRVSR